MKSNSLNRFLSLVSLAALVTSLAVLPAHGAEKRFLDDGDSKHKDEPQEFLKDYDKLVKGKGADWVFFEGFDPKAYKTVSTKPFGVTSKEPRVKMAAEYGQNYLEQWIQKSKKLGWEVAKEGAKADLKIEGNVAYAWEPSGAARFWGGIYVNPGAVQELIGRDSSGKIVFQIRHKSKGSTIMDAVENGLEDCVESMEKGK